MQKAIIHKLTRVILRLTTDDNPDIKDNEEIVELASPIDLADGPWKLDSQNNKVPASLEEYQQATITPQQVNINSLKANIDILLSDASVADSVKNVMRNLKALFN